MQSRESSPLMIIVYGVFIWGAVLVSGLGYLVWRLAR